MPENTPGQQAMAAPDHWVMRAQDGHAEEVLGQVAVALAGDPTSQERAEALYAQALALMMLDRLPEAVDAARELVAVCRDGVLIPIGVMGRAVLVDLLRRQGRLEESVDQLAHAVALESGLGDPSDPRARAALAALVVALRLSGVPEEARRVERRLAGIDGGQPRDNRVSRQSNQALEHAVEAMTAARRRPFCTDAELIARAVEEIREAARLAEAGSYEVVADEAEVLAGLAEAVSGDPVAALARLQGCAGVLDRGTEAVAIQLLWGSGRVRAQARLGRTADAIAEGRAVLATVAGSSIDGDREVLAYEVLRVEHPGVEQSGTGGAAFVRLGEGRQRSDTALLTALFRARVEMLRAAEERRHLARTASLDTLTGLVNRRRAAEDVAAAAARPAGEPVALLLVDLDGFAEVNVSCGHQAGDVVLQRVAGQLSALARPDDVVARWAGDKFVVVAPLSEVRARSVADRLRDLVRDCFEPGAEDAVTASVGVAVREAPVEPDEWIRRADVAVFAAKRAGGDATVTA